MEGVEKVSWVQAREGAASMGMAAQAPVSMGTGAVIRSKTFRFPGTDSLGVGGSREQHLLRTRCQAPWMVMMVSKWGGPAAKIAKREVSRAMSAKSCDAATFHLSSFLGVSPWSGRLV